MNTLLKIQEVAEKLSISENQVYVLKATGKLPYIKIGRSTRFDEEDIADFIRARKHKIE
jgi:excisionase family DNA binding protein